jgi:hypothetical protein
VPGSQTSVGTAAFLLCYAALHLVALAITASRPGPHSSSSLASARGGGGGDTAWLSFAGGDWQIDWGRGLGSLAAANAGLLVVPATRNSALTWLLGLPFDRVVVYHRYE